MKNRASAFRPTILALLLVNLTATSESCPDFAGLLNIGGNRRIYLECRGSGFPTVVLVSGTGGAFDEWTHVFRLPGAAIRDDAAILPQLARSTRVCAYDRPGARRFDNTLTPSTAVSQPTTAQIGVADLHALLSAANEPGPYVLVGFMGRLDRQTLCKHLP